MVGPYLASGVEKHRVFCGVQSFSFHFVYDYIFDIFSEK